MRALYTSIRRTLLITFVFSFFISGDGCSYPDTSKKQTGNQTGVEAAIGRAATATSLYSFRYYNGLRTLYIQLPAYDPAVTCSSFMASRGSQYSDVWYLELYIAWSTPQTDVSLGTVFPPTGGDAASAYVGIIHAQSSPRARWMVNALTGRVRLTLAPSNETDQIAGSQIRGHLDFTLPKFPRALTSCQGQASMGDGGEFETKETCICVDGTGATSTCIADTERNCCTPLTNDVDTFSMDIIANPCGFFCATTPGDPNSCAELSATN